MPHQVIKYASDCRPVEDFDTLAEAQVYDAVARASQDDNSYHFDRGAELPRGAVQDIAKQLVEMGLLHEHPPTTPADTPEAWRLRFYLRECLSWMDRLRASGDAGSWDWGPKDVYTMAKACEERGGRAPE